MGVGDILIHIDENLDDNGIKSLEREISAERGVVSACVNEKTRHLVVVDFDPATVRPSELVQVFRSRGLHATMVGL